RPDEVPEATKILRMRARVLVVEDEPENRLLLRVVLGAEGYDVEEAEDGPTALAAAARQQPDLILLDVMMPGMNGYAVLERLRSGTARPDPPRPHDAGGRRAGGAARAQERPRHGGDPGGDAHRPRRPLRHRPRHARRGRELRHQAVRAGGTRQPCAPLRR